LQTLSDNYMEKPIIQVTALSKKYKITHERGGYVTIRDVITNIIRRPFAFLRTTVKRSVGLEKKEIFWALKDVSFEVKKGEAIGVIGKNGAGKSTLLKILSQITPPSAGEVILRGHVGSLLEVGTGFHPELTGRENIFLNGAILGMSRKDITNRFDEIVQFSGIGKFLDTPVKFYSSGMYVRLAFSVAVHMEPDILLIDEVLAVGDAEFQKKCIAKLEEIIKRDHLTIFFVSHNLATIQSFCDRAILLENGAIKMIGQTDKVVAEYIDNSTSSSILTTRNRKGQQDVQLNTIEITDERGSVRKDVITGDKINFLLQISSRNTFKNPTFDIGIRNRDNVPLSISTTKVLGEFSGSKKILIKPEDLRLAKGTYRIDLTLYAETQGMNVVQDHIVGAMTVLVKESSDTTPSWMENSTRELSSYAIID